jgi:hypothetical protein
MIVDSTPGSLVWQDETGQIVTFFGEWTLEPKFYLPLQRSMHWNDSGETRLTNSELATVLGGLLLEGTARGWTIVVEPGVDQ